MAFSLGSAALFLSERTRGNPVVHLLDSTVWPGFAIPSSRYTMGEEVNDVVGS